MAVKKTATERINEFVDRFAFYTYWILGLLIVGSVSYILYNNNKQVAGVLVFMAGVIAVYFYYVKWFLSPDSAWPPVTSTCPDFLTAAGSYENPSKSGEYAVFCRDYVGVGSLTKSSSTDTAITDWATGQAAVTANKAIAIGFDKNTGIPLTGVCDTVAAKGLTFGYCDSI